ncbi:MAG: hypothetical protein JF565_00100 [Propionibacteriales bacterium]|nr:hypothetical protein [Propionibacteriales bacterium]
MNTIADQGTIAPEVQDFLAAVRAQLADLDPEEQREILDGLEADLADLVAERGGEALGDPVAYARELRTAAGLEPVMGRPVQRTSVSAGVQSFLDDAHALFDRSTMAMPGDASGLLEALQPAWWVLRAWVAVEVAAYFLGEWSLQVIPGTNVVGAIALAAAVVLSVQLGRGRLWPGARWRTAAGWRLLLLSLNVFAVVMVPVVLQGLQHGRDQAQAYAQPSAASATGLQLNGRPVRNIYPYDAQGNPLTGIQLLDRRGRPLVVDNGLDVQEESSMRLLPWLNGRIGQLNVFPLPEQALDPSTGQAVDDGSMQLPPVNHLPPVSLAGVTPSVLQAVGAVTAEN